MADFRQNREEERFMEEAVSYGFLSTVPILVLVLGVLITKKMLEMLLLSTLVGAVIVYKAGFFSGYIELLYGTLAGSMYQLLFLILIFCGPMIVLYEKSGSLLGFSNIVNKVSKTRNRSLFFAWVLGIVVFIDDYLNALAVAAAMRNITDRLRVPREHLAYTVNSTGACVCVIVPFTSWAAFAIGCMQEYGLDFGDYVASIPFMFYPWAAVIISLLTAIGVFPKIGPLKKAYQRVEAGGETTLPPDKSGAIPIVSMESAKDVKPVNPLNFLIPIAGLVIVMILFDNDMIHGLIAALVIQGILYIAQRIMTLTQYMNALLEGVTSMANLIFTILIAFTLAGINEKLGFSEYVIDLFTRYISPSILPALTFLICAFIAFTSCSFWALIVIGTPVFVPLALGLGVSPAILIAGIMSGVSLGSQCCFYSDAVFMTAAGTGVSNVPQVRTAAPYVLIGVAIATVAFLIVGFTM
jgi:Na+/H+ antiporter NhaC